MLVVHQDDSDRIETCCSALLITERRSRTTLPLAVHGFLPLSLPNASAVVYAVWFLVQHRFHTVQTVHTVVQHGSGTGWATRQLTPFIRETPSGVTNCLLLTFSSCSGLGMFCSTSLQSSVFVLCYFLTRAGKNTALFKTELACVADMNARGKRRWK